MEQATRFCENCGSPLEEGASFCEACGVPVTGAAEIEPAPPARSRPQPPASPPPPAAYYQPAQPPPPPPAAYYQPAQPPPPPPAAYYQPAQPPPPPPAAYYQPVQPPPPPPAAYYQPGQPPLPGSYYPPPLPPRRKQPTWLIVGGVVVALLVCCGLAVLVGSLVGGASILSQIPGLGQNLPPAIVAEETPSVADTAVPFTQDTEIPAIVDESTLTSEPAPNEPQATPVLPAPQGQPMEFTDDLMTNDNQWSSFGGDTPPRRGYLISVYFIETTKEIGELRAFIPKIDNDQYKVRDFEIDFYGLLFSGDGYLGLDFHYVDDQNYYQVAIKDGSFLIRKKINGQFINLTHGPWVRSNSIWETGPNHIKVICHGDVIRLEVNDGLMVQLKDDSLPEGDAVLTSGVLPEAPDGTTAEARFGNFHVVWWR